MAADPSISGWHNDLSENFATAQKWHILAETPRSASQRDLLHAREPLLHHEDSVTHF